MAKPFTWSYSRLKNWRSCPYKHQQVDLLRKYTESNEQLVYGNKVHKAFADALTGKSPLPREFDVWEKWVKMIKLLPGDLLVEQKFAVDRSLSATEYFGPKVWMRGIGDAIKIDGTRAAAIDFKTGKMKHDSEQLVLMAQCLFSHHSELEKIRATFIWLQDDAITSDNYTREDVANAWKNGLLAEVEEMEQAAQTQHYPKHPSGLCKAYCPVSDCEFFQKGTPR